MIWRGPYRIDEIYIFFALKLHIKTNGCWGEFEEYNNDIHKSCNWGQHNKKMSISFFFKEKLLWQRKSKVRFEIWEYLFENGLTYVFI